MFFYRSFNAVKKKTELFKHLCDNFFFSQQFFWVVADWIQKTEEHAISGLKSGHDRLTNLSSGHLPESF